MEVFRGLFGLFKKVLLDNSMPKHDNLGGEKPTGQRKRVMAATVYVAIHPELKRLIGEDADTRNLPMNERIAQILAEHYGRPELGEVPRGKLGRPRKQPAPA
jgi:hypothetical protein